MRKVQLLVVLHRRSVLLEQRAPTGIWGGLLSLPQYVRRQDLNRGARRYAHAPIQALAERRHGFTHFTLAFTPYVVVAAGTRRPAADGVQRWLALSRLEGAALPAPIITLLRELRDGAADDRTGATRARIRNPRSAKPRT